MPSAVEQAIVIADRIATLAPGQKRRLIAVAGPPASGKSTVAQALQTLLCDHGTPTGLVAMDGFHLGNSILDQRDLRAKKGAPETFDLAGFAALLTRLINEDQVFAPTFDRALDAAIGSAVCIAPEMKTVIVEGNYLLLDEPGWRDLGAFWSFSVFLSYPPEVLKDRLVQRWIDHGFSQTEALDKAVQNDLPNMERTIRNGGQPDLTLTA